MVIAVTTYCTKWDNPASGVKKHLISGVMSSYFELVITGDGAPPCWFINGAVYSNPLAVSMFIAFEKMCEFIKRSIKTV